MNKAFLIGRLTRDPELRYSSSNTAVVNFTIAIDRQYTNAQGQRETDFINVIVWRKQAENTCNYLDKGSLVSIEGRLQTGSYDDKDGNKRYTMDVVADSVQFLESKGQAQSRSTASSASPYDYQDNNVGYTNDVNVADDPFADFGDSVSIDDNFLD